MECEMSGVIQKSTNPVPSRRRRSALIQQMKATITYLPPFQPSAWKTKNVPSIKTKTTAANALTTTTTTTAKTTTTTKTQSDCDGDRSGSSCCHQQSHKKSYDVDAHATMPRWQLCNNNKNHNNNNNSSTNCSVSSRSLRNARECRCRNFHSNTYSSSNASEQKIVPVRTVHTKDQSNVNASATATTRLAAATKVTSLDIMTMAAIASTSPSCMFVDSYPTINEAGKHPRDETLLNVIKTNMVPTQNTRNLDCCSLHSFYCSQSPSSSSSNSSTSSCCCYSAFVTQLDMPIAENCFSCSRLLENVVATKSAVGSTIITTTTKDVDRRYCLQRSRNRQRRQQQHQEQLEEQTCLTQQSFGGATMKTSQTTTLESRCFKGNGDTLSEVRDDDNEDDYRMSQHDYDYEYENDVNVAVQFENLALRSRLRTLKLQWLLLLLMELWQQISMKHLHLMMTAKNFITTKLITLLVLLMMTTTANCWAGRQDVASNCTFPARWEGSWFLSGYQQSIHIKGSQFSYRGKCAASDGNKYLIVDEKGCHRCLVIYEKHKNVLQYKESECEGDSMYLHQSNPSALAMRSSISNQASELRGGAHPNSNGHSRLSSSDQYIMRSNDDMNDYFCKGRETLQNLCDQIPGDALLYSLFRESAEPVKCPLKGPFIFTYNRGHGECKSPVSNIESCTEDSRLLLSFQACPDVQGTESTVEELTCLATWKDGNSRYLVGLVSHHHAISNEERYRCFVYEKMSTLMGSGIVTSKDAEYKLAQSGDATCNGLDSAEVGSRIMSLRKPPATERCDFPIWFKGPRHWHVLMGNAVYNYHTNDGSIHIIKPNGYMETRALCEQINKQTATEMMAVVHYTTGCQSGFMCMMFYRRDTHVIEIQTGKQASRLEDACAPDHFDINKTPYTTLLASNPDHQPCPMEGLYTLRGAIGPPYLTTRHKRNHNNKAHGMHGHHHFNIESGSTGGAGGFLYGQKRHTTLSFRSSERIERGSWHGNTRGLPIRSRRAIAPENLNNSQAKGELIFTLNSTDSTTVDSDLIALQRNRRDAPTCITNYKAQRQLWVGCTEPNVLDVRPLCTDEGDEEYSCHGSWAENSTFFIVARHKGTKHGVCITYHPTEGNAAQLIVGDACYRAPAKPPEHHLVANLTVLGKCGETSGTTAPHIVFNEWMATMAVALLVAILGHLQMSNLSQYR